jgi:hypothetical protein
MPLVIVDANVARSAGQPKPDAGAPAPQCVDALEAIRDRAYHHGDLQIAMSQELLQEWAHHARSFALTWLYDLRSRGFVQSFSLDSTMQDSITRAATTVGQNCRVPVEKDKHLVSLALQTDRRVVSNETRLPRHLANAAAHLALLSSIHWAHPINPIAITWLRSGAPENEDLYIGTEGD